MLLTTTVSPVLQLDQDMTPVDGATSSLRRDADGITLEVQSVALPPGVHTITVVVFNNPEFCEGNCSEDDYSRPEVDASVIFGTGQVVEGDGQATFVVSLGKSDEIVDPGEAEIVFFIRSHGPVIPEQLDVQLTTIDGGCDVNQCADVQTGRHLSPQTVVTTSQLLQFDQTFAPIGDTISRITRINDSVTFTLDTLGLRPGAYTVWIVAFNIPENCVAQCAPMDVLHTEPGGPNPSVFFGGGGVVDESGRGTFNGTRAAEDISGSPESPFGGPGIVDPYQAELHLVVRDHGPVIPERLQEQISTFEGGCDVFDCVDVQVSPHPPAGPPSLQVMSLDATSTGFAAEFNAELDESLLNLYDNETAGWGRPTLSSKEPRLAPSPAL